MNPDRRVILSKLFSPVSTLILIVCFTPLQAFLILTLQSFPWSGCPIGFHSATCLFTNHGLTGHIFEEDDCQDLCTVWSDQSIEKSSSVKENPTQLEEAVLVRRAKPTDYRSSHRLRSAPLWSNPPPLICESCDGEGGQPCRFCGGTDFLSAIGGDTDALFYDGIGQECPVCNDGVELCQKCAGTGYIFSWKQARNVSSHSYP